MSPADNRQIIQTFFDAANCGDMDSCFRQLASDVIWTNIGSTQFSGTYSGKDILVEKLLTPLFGRLKAGIFSIVENIVAEGEFVVVQSRGSAETKNGRPYNNTYCHVFRIRNGKIIAVMEYFDTELTSSVFGSD